MIGPIKNLPDSRLSTAVMIVSGLMIVVGTVAAPGDGSPIWIYLVWLGASLTLISFFLVTLSELVRRFFKEG